MQDDKREKLQAALILAALDLYQYMNAESFVIPISREGLDIEVGPSKPISPDGTSQEERKIAAARHLNDCPYWGWDWNYSWDKTDCTCDKRHKDWPQEQEPDGSIRDVDPAEWIIDR